MKPADIEDAVPKCSNDPPHGAVGFLLDKHPIRVYDKDRMMRGGKKHEVLSDHDAFARGV